ncbi:MULTISPECIES: spondin domain-containing protein [unclassified Roseovarius]|uniref:spondin domain-containing protein n=1 Tax=unclassified Roseovarius TaxID=2614913 RepID=UPI00273FC0E0|nr:MULTISPECIES: spondin domain-containing protein [unclassified Roseovarius]
MKVPKISGRGIVASVVASVSFAAAAQATTLEITITNTAQIGGFAITPVYSAFHDGNFDAFDAGSAASAGVELIAETGSPGGLPAERLAVSPDSVATVVAAPGSGPPTIDPGETTTATIDVDGSINRYFTFLSMLVPSNDTFLGNDDPLAYSLFDDFGNFSGERVIDVTASLLWDAGTEVNDPLGGPAFVAMQDAADGVAENGVVHGVESFAAFAGVETPLGILDGNLIDFGNDLSQFSVATITIREVSGVVPLPAAGLFGLSGLLGLGGLSVLRRRKKGSQSA